ncbi:MAG: ABC transporter permease subunit [Bacillota bacterium]|nr:ABC transporter permease subunit [Bacillota bacterium]
MRMSRAERLEAVRHGLLVSVLRKLAGDRLALLGLGIILTVVAVAFLAPYVANDPVKVDLAKRLAPSSALFPLGTDHLGRCILSRLIYGTQVSLPIAGLTLAVIILIGIPIGILSGYCGGRVDNIIMRVVDVLLAFPSLVLALVIAGMLGPGLINVLIALASVWWVEYARFVRAIVLSVKAKEFVLAARASGTSDVGIMTRHILPDVLSPVIVLATLDMGKLILVISGLSFLGLGAQPPAPEWGAMLNDGRPYLQVAPQLMLYPGLAIMTVVLAFNLLGDGLRDALDPRDTVRV